MANGLGLPLEMLANYLDGRLPLSDVVEHHAKLEHGSQLRMFSAGATERLGKVIMSIVHDERPSLAELDLFRRWLADIVDPNLDIERMLEVDRDRTIDSMRALMRHVRAVGSDFTPIDGCNAGVLALFRMIGTRDLPPA